MPQVQSRTWDVGLVTWGLSMIAILDYEAGNLGSVTNAFRYLDISARVVTEPSGIQGCQAIVLPGVGSFGDCLQKLRARGFEGPVRDWIAAGKPFLGICVGLQALFEGSEESPGVPGLGLLPGTIRRFEATSELKVPQIGWNQIRQQRRDCPLFQNLADEAFVYFVHSYYAEASGEAVAGVTRYGTDYASVLWRDNLMAVQFHPEKSQKVGLIMLQNFADWAYERTASR